jgi:hypothetical protein
MTNAAKQEIPDFIQDLLDEIKSLATFANEIVEAFQNELGDVTDQVNSVQLLMMTKYFYENRHFIERDSQGMLMHIRQQKAAAKVKKDLINKQNPGYKNPEVDPVDKTDDDLIATKTSVSPTGKAE